jgi:hypothetical protein
MFIGSVETNTGESIQETLQELDETPFQLFYGQDQFPKASCALSAFN